MMWAKYSQSHFLNFFLPGILTKIGGWNLSELAIWQVRCAQARAIAEIRKKLPSVYFFQKSESQKLKGL